MNLLLSQRFGSTAPASWRRVCQSQKYPLCFNGGIGIAKTGIPIEIDKFSPFLGGATSDSSAISNRHGSSCEPASQTLDSLASTIRRGSRGRENSLAANDTPHAAKATQAIPIIYAMSADPVQLGIAKSLAKPGGNSTGVTFLSDQLAAKRLETFKEAAPRIARVALVRDASHADNELPVAERAAKAMNLKLVPVEIHDPAELDRTLETAKESGIDSLYVVSSRHTVANAQRIVEFANRQRLPLVAGWGAWVRAGGLISYGPNVAEMIRQASRYLDPVLKGANPGDLPVQQPTRFELFVNLKTAKALGLDIPESFLLRADKVIE